MKLTRWAPLLLLALSGCGFVAGSGRVVSQDRAFAPFHKVSIPGVADVSVVRGAGSITVTTDDNLLSYVTTEVKGDTLVVDTVNRPPGLLLGPTHGIKVVVSTPEDPNDVNLSGTGSFTWDDAAALTVDTLRLDLSGTGSLHGTIAVTSLNADISGTGSMHLSGVGTNGTFDLSGTGSLHAFDVQLQAATVTVSGTGGAEVTVRDSLDATIEGTGSVHYRGSPSVTRHLTGTGTVSKAD
jgi:hypothetical protein